MRIVLLLYVLSVLLSCSNPVGETRQDANIVTNTFKNHLAEDKLAGMVSSVTYFTCNSNGDSCCLASKVTYNSEGNRIKDVQYNCPDPNAIIVGDWYWFEYYYDSLGRVSHVIKMQDENTKVYEWIEEYDSTDQQARRYFVDHWTTGDTTTLLVSYDSLNRCTGYVEISVDEWGESETGLQTISFNDTLNTITSEWIDGNTTTKKMVETFNNDGLLIDILQEGREGLILEHVHYEYTGFDKNGNWISRTLTNSNGTISMEKREIEES